MIIINLLKHTAIKIYVENGLLIKATDKTGNELLHGVDYEITIKPGEDPDAIEVNLPSGISVYTAKQ